MIEARGLTKRYGDKLAVDQLSFRVEPGRITGFLGPNGAGKTTTMRLILGLDRPTRGTVTVNGREFRTLARRGPGGGLVLEGEGEQVDGLRALCAAAWSGSQISPEDARPALERLS